MHRNRQPFEPIVFIAKPAIADFIANGYDIFVLGAMKNLLHPMLMPLQMLFYFPFEIKKPELNLASGANFQIYKTEHIEWVYNLMTKKDTSYKWTGHSKDATDTCIVSSRFNKQPYTFE